MTVADYVVAMQRNEITVNREYQRFIGVWPPIARSYLIESIILGFPIPKLSLHQRTDLKSRSTVKEIVDGQQRSGALREYFEDKYALSKALETEELQGRLFSDLAEEHQTSFVEAQLSIDVFLAATEEQVRETFRRMNSYTYPLNGEEKRHSEYQGPFKWFVNRLAKQYAQSWLAMGVFKQNQLTRMADTKLITEVCDALANGIRTTRKQNLDGLYRSRDKTFEEEARWEARLSATFDQLLAWPTIHKTKLMKAYNVYALSLAVSHVTECLRCVTITTIITTTSSTASTATTAATAMITMDESGDTVGPGVVIIGVAGPDVIMGGGSAWKELTTSCARPYTIGSENARAST